MEEMGERIMDKRTLSDNLRNIAKTGFFKDSIAYETLRQAATALDKKERERPVTNKELQALEAHMDAEVEALKKRLDHQRKAIDNLKEGKQDRVTFMGIEVVLDPDIPPNEIHIAQSSARIITERRRAKGEYRP